MCFWLNIACIGRESTIKLTVLDEERLVSTSSPARERCYGGRPQVADVGVQRQYTGIAGRIEDARLEVFAYASRHGYTLIDREIYLPRCWSDDAARCAASGIPEHVRCSTKIALARRTLTCAAQVTAAITH
jgi:hypothetical protein